MSVSLICAFAFISHGPIAFASESQGTIPSGFNLTRICQNIACSRYGNVNWKPTLNANTTGATPVTITDSGISGYLWGDEIGWINLQPTGAGVTVNPNTGALSGYAYASVGSWINFSPTAISGGPPVGVSINSSGQFTGWAYVSGIYGGWMEFDCLSASTCIQTDWRSVPSSSVSSNPVNSATGSGSGFSSGGSTPERQAADLAAIWAYNNIQPAPSSTTSPALLAIVGSENVPANQSGGQPISEVMPGNTVINVYNRNRNSSSTIISLDNPSRPISMSSFLKVATQSPLTTILVGIVFVIIVILLIVILL